MKYSKKLEYRFKRIIQIILLISSIYGISTSILVLDFKLFIISIISFAYTIELLTKNIPVIGALQSKRKFWP